MPKKIRDVTFEEFNKYCNARACDGQWSAIMAMVCIEVHDKIYQVKPLFGKKKARERKWQEIKGDYFVLDSEIEI